MAKDIRTLPFFLAPFASFFRDFAGIMLKTDDDGDAKNVPVLVDKS